MNKIQELIDNGTIHLDDVLEYANNYMMKKSYESQIDNYYQNEYPHEEYNMTQEEIEYEQMRMMDDMYGDQLMQEMTKFPEHSADPEYIVASTWFKMEETMIFECNEDGYVSSPSEYGCFARRLGHDDWLNTNKAVIFVFPKKKYHPIREINNADGYRQVLYRRYDTDENDAYWEERYQLTFGK